MKKVAMALATMALLTLWAPLASAHHSGAMYDFSKNVPITGVVKAIRVINPHLSVTLDYMDNGVEKTIEFEGHSANNMYRGGWRPDKVKVGDKVTINTAPRRDGKDGGYVTSIITKTGEWVGFKPPTSNPVVGNAPPPVGEPVNGNAPPPVGEPIAPGEKPPASVN